MLVRCIPLFAVALLSGVAHAAAPTITSTPDRIATVAREYRYDVDASDADNDRLSYARTGPAASTIDAASGLLRWTPAASDLGLKAFTVTADDGRGGRATQAFDVRVVERYCALYPIAIPRAAVANLASGAVVNQLPRGTGAGNYSWLSWSGSNSAPTLANSLLPPGDSYSYVNLDNAADKVLDIGDWVQGGPGNMNAAAVRTNLDALKARDIIVPTYSTTRGQGAGFDYKVAGFITIRLRDYQLNGQGWLSFEYRGATPCYNAAPVATAQSVTTNEDSAKAIVLTATDAENDALSYSVTTQPTHGTLSGTAPNLTYTPAANYHGTDSFTFKVKDAGAEAAATVSITVTPVNDAPSATAQSIATNEDTAQAIVLAGSDLDGDALTFVIASAPAHGTLTGTVPNLVYTPDAHYHGADSFTFKSNDGNAMSPAATVTITIAPVNDAPVALAQAISTDRDVARVITLAGTDADGDALTYRITTAPTHGTLALDGARATYTPATGYTGADSFAFTVKDAALESAPATVAITIEAVNRAPIATAQSVSTDEDVALAIVLAATDADGDALSFEVTTAPTHGTLSGTAPTLTYTPSAHYVGTDTLTFVAKDATTSSAPATVTITVRAVNAAPVANAQSVQTARDTAKTIALSATDADNDALTYRIATNPSHGTAALSGNVVTYTPTTGYTGSDSFAFVANDGTVDSAPATVALTITADNRAPTITSTPITTLDENTAYRYPLTATDPDGDTLAFSADRLPTGLALASSTGLLDGMPTGLPVQGVQDLNTQCYLVPEGARAVGGNGSRTYRAALYQRIVEAIERGSDYLVPQTLAWENAQTERCLGCHVQTQVVSGLQAATKKADVDVAASDRLLNDLIAAQQADGSIYRNDLRYPVTQTALALWSLDEGRDRAHTREARRRALDYLYTQRRESNAGLGPIVNWADQLNMGAWFAAPHVSGVTAIIAKGASRFIDEIDADPAATAAQRATAAQYRALMQPVALYIYPYMGQAAVSSNLTRALQIYAVSYARRHIDNPAQLAAIDTMLARGEALLRERQRADGSWSLFGTDNGASDPLVTAWAGFALQALQVPANDPAVLRLIAYLLDAQQADGRWTVDIRTFTTPLAGTSLVVAYLPTALEHLGNADLTVGDIVLDGNMLTAQIRNRGVADVMQPLRVQFFQGATLLGETTLARLASDHSATAAISVPTAPTADVRVTVEAAATTECDTTNNDASAGLLAVRAQDPQGLFDRQQWLLNVADVNSAPVFTSTPITRLEQGRAYPHQLSARDADRGDAVRFALINGPAGLYSTLR